MDVTISRLEDIMLTDQLNTTTRTLSNLKKSLTDSLERKYQSAEATDQLLSIHGLSKDGFDFISNSERVINERINDVSIDDNSNKDEKTIEGIIAETVAPTKKAIGFDYLFRSMKNLYGKQEANRLMGEMLDFSLGLSDSTNILKPYCYSLDASKLVTIGRDFGLLHSSRCKRISSYISALCETIHQMSQHLAGAVAIGSFFLDIAHLLLIKDKYRLSDLLEPNLRKEVENEYQQFVHSVNHLSRNAQESPFTNISIFDREKLKTLVNAENYAWYFKEEGTEIPNHVNDLGDLPWDEYVIQYILECQNIFLDFFDKGDPLENGLPYRFPVVTLNVSKKDKNGKFVPADEIFLKDVCKRDIYRYNIFSSIGTKVASCCRLINDTELLELASQSNSFGGASISLGSHRVITINFVRIVLESSSEEEFYQILHERIISCAKILKAHKELIKELEKRGLQQFITKGWINLNRLFSTFGILGIVEANLLAKKKFKAKDDFIKSILIFLNENVANISKEYGIIGNIEQIPAESFARRLVQADKIIFGCKNVPFTLYANQFVPLWEDATIFEKFEIDGKYNQLITGGGIVHGTIGEKITSKQAEKLIKYAIECGCEHFALNMVYHKCLNGHVGLGKVEQCPQCSEAIVDYMTRVVGFFTKVSSWNKTRREWEFPKRHIHNKEEFN